MVVMIDRRREREGKMNTRREIVESGVRDFRSRY